MKKIICTLLALCMLIGGVSMLASCGKDKESDANGIAEILTERTNDGTKIIIKYTDPTKEDAVFIIPDGAQGEKGEKGDQGIQGEKGEKGDQGIRGEKGEDGRGILSVEIIDGCLWITYTDDPETLVFIGRLDGEDETTSPEPTDPQDPPIVTPPEDDPGYTLPEKVNMNGYAYKAYVRSNAQTDGDMMQDGNPAFACEDFWVTGVPEDALGYSVYTRNKEIEADYNVKIRQIPQSINMVQELTNFYGNTEKYDLTIILAVSAAQAATKNLLTELKGLSQLDLTHEAYDQNSIRELSMGGKLYYLSGDMNISTLDSVAPTVVNLDRYKNYAEGFVEHFRDSVYADIYHIVTSGKWTIDTMLQMAILASSDADPTDGPLGAFDQDDVGYFMYDQSFVYYFYGAGGRLTKMTEEGSPEFVIQNPQNGELYDFIYDNFHPSVSNKNFPHGYSADRKTNFIINGNTLFTDMILWDVRQSLYIDADFEYGLLPNPVYEEGDDYNAVVYFYNTVHLWAIPSLCGDIEKAQIMMNVMAAYSNIKKVGSTMDGYYTRTLYFTVAPDPDARKVMDIIKGSTVYDIALLYDWGSWRTHFSEMYYRNLSKEYAALVQLMPNSAIPQLEETIELFKNPSLILD